MPRYEEHLVDHARCVRFRCSLSFVDTIGHLSRDATGKLRQHQLHLRISPGCMTVVARFGVPPSGGKGSQTRSIAFGDPKTSPSRVNAELPTGETSHATLGRCRVDADHGRRTAPPQERTHPSGAGATQERPCTPFAVSGGLTKHSSRTCLASARNRAGWHAQTCLSVSSDATECVIARTDQGPQTRDYAFGGPIQVCPCHPEHRLPS